MPEPRLRVSPAFALTHALDGKPYVAQETEPYLQYWLSERDCAVLAAFAGHRGRTADDGLDAVQRLMQTEGQPAERRRMERTLTQMLQAGVLQDTRADTSRYDRRIVDAYLKERPFPQAVCDAIVAAGGIGQDSRVLDLAGGPGDLALKLARVSRHVTLMDLSRAFVNAARTRARAAGLPLATLHESANRLMFLDDAFDAITISQALHWLDDVQVCRGVGRLLRPGGSFFVVHAAIEVDDAHPLAHVFGWNSIFGAKPRRAFADEVAPLQQRLALLFDALGAPGVDSHYAGTRSDVAPVMHTATTLYLQPRPIDEGFARAFLTDRHIQAAGREPAAFWHDLGARCAAAPAGALQGLMHWALMHFRRGGPRAAGSAASPAVI